MAEQTKSRLPAIIVGLVLVIGGVLCVIYVKRGKPIPEEPPPVRPLNTMVVGAPSVQMGAKYPGKVAADQEVNLAFQVDGPLIEFPVSKGQNVKAGDLLARIDPRDFENSLASAKAEYEQAKTQLERIEKAVQTGAVSRTDLTNAQAKYQTTDAQMKIATKALEDTYLYAKFGGLVANTFVENFENVKAKQAVLSLQDVSSVTIDVSVPEKRIAVVRDGDRERFRFAATFDYLPDREFDVTVKEFSTEADPLTQTYTVSFLMPSPNDLKILPGMTATVTEYEKGEAASGSGFSIPISAVPVDGLGQYYVWRVNEDADGKLTVHRVDVSLGQVMEDKAIIADGLARGDRIATAGVHFLQEGQQVRLIERSE